MKPLAEYRVLVTHTGIDHVALPHHTHFFVLLEINSYENMMLQYHHWNYMHLCVDVAIVLYLWHACSCWGCQLRSYM